MSLNTPRSKSAKFLRRSLLLLALAPAAAALSASAQVTQNTTTFTDGFGSYAPGAFSTTTTPGSTYYTAATNTTGDSATTVNTDTGNLFGLGTNNQYLQVSDLNNAASSTTENFASRNTLPNSAQPGNTAGVVTQGMLSLAFIMPTVASVTPASTAYSNATGNSLLLRLGGGNSNGFTAFAVAFRGSTDGTTGILSAVGANASPSATTLATLTLGQVYSLNIVFNYTNSAYTYAGSNVLAADSIDIYLNGALVGHNQSAVNGTSDPLGTSTSTASYYSFNSPAGATADTLYVDNVALSTIVSVPEPKSTLLLGACGLLLGVHQFRRLRRRTA